MLPQDLKIPLGLAGFLFVRCRQLLLGLKRDGLELGDLWIDVRATSSWLMAVAAITYAAANRMSQNQSPSICTWHGYTVLAVWLDFHCTQIQCPSQYWHLPVWEHFRAPEVCRRETASSPCGVLFQHSPVQIGVELQSLCDFSVSSFILSVSAFISYFCYSSEDWKIEGFGIRNNLLSFNSLGLSFQFLHLLGEEEF